VPEVSKAGIRPLHQGRLDAIDFAVKELGIRSFADLAGIAQVYGRYAFHTIDEPAVQRGVLADIRITKTGRDHLLTMLEEASKRPGLRVLENGGLDPQTLAHIGTVDAILLFDVLLHMVDPDWDEVLELCAARTSCFVIANPQWEGGGETIRLMELGREGFLAAVPPTQVNLDFFDRLDDWFALQLRPYRDATNVWQWGITDKDLTDKMHELGFGLGYERSFNKFPGAESFVNKAFVFNRRDGSDGITTHPDESDEFTALKRELERARRERDEWRARHTAVEQTVTDLLGSMSWRLTEPLRTLKRRRRR
jgi:hypothetical protein